MFSNKFIITKEEYLQEMENKTRNFISEEEKERRKAIFEKQKETAEIYEYIKNTRPELIAREDRIKTLVLHPFMKKKSLFRKKEDSSEDFSPDAPIRLIELKKITSTIESESFLNHIFKVDNQYDKLNSLATTANTNILDEEQSIETESIESTPNQEQSQIQAFSPITYKGSKTQSDQIPVNSKYLPVKDLSFQTDQNQTIEQSRYISSSILPDENLTLSTNTSFSNPMDSGFESRSLSRASISSIHQKPKIQNTIEWRRPSTFSQDPLHLIFGEEDKEQLTPTKIICNYSFKFPPPDDITKLRSLGKEGHVSSIDELIERWGNMMELQQLESYYIWDHQALEELIQNYGSKIQRLFLKIHPLQETFLSFYDQLNDRLLFESLLILHLEMPKSLEEAFCEQMKYLLKGISEFHFRMQRQRYTETKLLEKSLYDCFIENCNVILRHLSIEGIEMTKMWIVPLLQDFTSLQSIYIGMCRRVIAREENDEVLNAKETPKENKKDEPEDKSKSSQLTQNQTSQTQSQNQNQLPQDTQKPLKKQDSNTNLKRIESWRQLRVNTQIVNQQKVVQDGGDFINDIKRHSLGIKFPLEVQKNFLRELTLKKSEKYDLDPLIEMRTKHDTLTRVHFHQTDTVDDTTILTIACNCPNIVEMHLSETYITDLSLKYITQYLRKLKELTFIGPKITKFVELYPHTQLTNLNINAHHCSIEALLTLSFSFPVLQKLNLGARKNIFEGSLINDFLSIIKGEDIHEKERFYQYVENLSHVIFSELLHASKDLNLDILKQSILQSIEEMRNPNTLSNSFINLNQIPLNSPVATSFLTPSTPLGSHNFQIFSQNISPNSPQVQQFKISPKRRNTLGLPTVSRRKGFELIFDSIYDFLNQYVIVDEIAKPKPVEKKKKTLKEGKKKLKKKGKKKSKKKK